MAQSRVLMPQKSSQSQLMPAAMTAVGSYFGYPGLGRAAGQAYSQNQAGGGQVQPGQGVAAPEQKQGVGAALQSFVGNAGGGGGENQMQPEAPAAEQKPNMGSAMDRRMDAMGQGDPVETLWTAKAQMDTMPDYIREEYGPVIDQALYKAYESKPRRR